MCDKRAVTITEPASRTGCADRVILTKHAHQAKDASKTTTMPTTQQSSLNRIRLLYFFFRFSTGSIIPFLPLFMSSCGFTHEEIGKLQAIRPVVTMIFAPIWGALSDKTGKKKLILISTFVISAICRLSCAFFKDNMQLFATALFLTSVFYAAVTSLLDSIVVSSLSSKERLNFGKLRLWGELGNGISSTLMMHVSNNDAYGFEHLFVVHGVTAAVAVVFMLLCTPSNQHGQNQSKQTTKAKGSGNNDVILDWKRSLLDAFTNAEIASILGAVAVTGCTISVLENFSYINIRMLYKTHGREDILGNEISMYRIFHTSGGMLSWWCSGSWQKRLGPNGVIIASVCCVPLLFFLYAGVGDGLDERTKIGFAAAEAMRSAIFAALWSSATIRVNMICPAHMTAVLQAIMEASYRGVGSTVGAYFGGAMCKNFGIANAFKLIGRWLVSLLCTLGALLLSSSQIKGSHASK
mmetsp:Transcript_24483/g.38440  ORF Transcript_24483/g.38440 Transcript_24483/m.38440 type:complete len:466 (-) Transcript_24483:265-1662(-)